MSAAQWMLPLSGLAGQGEMTLVWPSPDQIILLRRLRRTSPFHPRCYSFHAFDLTVSTARRFITLLSVSLGPKLPQSKWTDSSGIGQKGCVVLNRCSWNRQVWALKDSFTVAVVRRLSLVFRSGEQLLGKFIWRQFNHSKLFSLIAT